MSKNVIRKRELTQKEADFYSNLDWKGKSKRLRKKANRILEHDCCTEWRVNDDWKNKGTNRTI